MTPTNPERVTLLPTNPERVTLLYEKKSIPFIDPFPRTALFFLGIFRTPENQQTSGFHLTWRDE